MRSLSCFFLISFLFFYSFSEVASNQMPKNKIFKNIVELVQSYKNNVISVNQLVSSIDENQLDYLFKPSFVSTVNKELLSTGTPVCRGVAVGKIFYSLGKAMQAAHKGEKVILVKENITNDELCNLENFSGIICFNEDFSTHASIVVKVSDKPYITHVNKDFIGQVREGDVVSLDAFEGKIFKGSIETVSPVMSPEIIEFMNIIDKLCPIHIHANADTQEEAKKAVYYGAKGIDPRTEHMFFSPEKLLIFRKVIFLKDGEEKQKAIKQLEVIQTEDFTSLFRVMNGLSMVIRLLDPPLHEFAPKDKKTINDIAVDTGLSIKSIEEKIYSMHEVNPMMGHRGVRLLITHPEILEMQIRALFAASVKVQKEGIKVLLNINIPMIIDVNEFKLIKYNIEKIKESETDFRMLDYKLGIMIETPRAAILSEELATEVDFISFGTNDLTGQTFALSRGGDLYEKFLGYYIKNGILTEDPFVKLDRAVGELVSSTIKKMKKINPKIYCGICGEQGSDPNSALFLYKSGIDSISCNPSEIPKIKLYLAKAAPAI